MTSLSLGKILLSLSFAFCFLTQAQEFPTKPIEIIVPFNPGGGSDVFVRIFQKAIAENNLSSEPLVVRNLGGAGGTVGSRTARDAKSDGHTILCLHDGIYTAQHFGNANWGPADFEPIAATGRSGVVIVVKGNSPFKNLAELMDEASARPYQVVYGTNLGAPSHYSALFLQEAKAGAKFRFTQTGGGARRLAQLKGGHIDVTSFSVAEYASFREAGIRALAVLSETRERALPDLPTAIEQGIKARHSLMQFWWAPKGTPPDRVAHLAGMLQRAMQTQAVRDRLKQLQIEPVFLTGNELKQSITSRSAQLKDIQVERPPSLPPLEWLVLGAVILFGAMVLRENRKEREDG